MNPQMIWLGKRDWPEPAREGVRALSFSEERERVELRGAPGSPPPPRLPGSLSVLGSVNHLGSNNGLCSGWDL